MSDPTPGNAGGLPADGDTDTMREPAGARAGGFVSLVGAGPGDPGLITAAGLQRLRDAEVVVYDRLAGDALQQYVREDAERVYVGKEPTRHTLTQDEINAVLVDRASKGKRVCRLKGGDPFVFGRGGEEALACRRAGIPFEVIPGVTSSIAAPAYAGIPVTHRQVAASFAVITGHEDPTRTSTGVHWEKLATAVDTLVFLMGVERLEEIMAQLVRHGRPPETPAALVQWGTLPNQRTLVSTVGEIARRCKEEGFRPPCVTIVGDVVGLRDQVAWFDRRPLFGRRILVTRSRDQSSDLNRLLAEQGAQVVEFPTIRIRPYALADCPDLPLSLEQGFDHVIFTSVNAVRCFFALVREMGGDARSVGRARVTAVGPVTAAAVEAAGLRVDFVPTEATSARITETFPEALAERRVLIPRAKVAPDDLPGAFRTAGAIVTVLPVYETLPEENEAEEVRAMVAAGEMDAITFTSSSTVRNFLQRIPADAVAAAIKIVCIGPVTAETASAAGLRVDAIAEPHTMPGLVKAVVQLLGARSDEP